MISIKGGLDNWIDIQERTNDPNIPQSGYIREFAKDGKIYFLDSSGNLIELPIQKKVFGEDFDYYKNLSEYTNNSNTPVVVMNFTTAQPLVDNADYRIGLQFGWKMDTTGRDFNARLKKDGNIIAEMNKESKDASNYDTRSWFAYFTQSGNNTANFTLEFWSEANGYTAFIKNIFFEIWRVK